MTKKKIK